MNWRTTIVTATMILTAAFAAKAVAQEADPAKTVDQIRAEVISQDGKIDVQKLLSNVRLVSKNAPDISGKKVMLVFSASWCGPCNAFHPVAEEIQKQNGDKLAIIYVYGGQSDKSIINARAAESAMTVTYDDSEKNLFEAFGVTGVPNALFIDGSGKLLARGTPAADGNLYSRDEKGGYSSVSITGLLK